MARPIAGANSIVGKPNVGTMNHPHITERANPLQIAEPATSATLAKNIHIAITPSP